MQFFLYATEIVCDTHSSLDARILNWLTSDLSDQNRLAVCNFIRVCMCAFFYFGVEGGQNERDEKIRSNER